MRIPGQAVFGTLVPADSRDTYAVTDPLYQRGGFRVVDEIADRDAITAERREVGMRVLVRANTVEYELLSDLIGWTVAQTPGSLVGTAYVTTAAGVAATADGGYFTVPTAGIIKLYRNVGGVATFVLDYPTPTQTIDAAATATAAAAGALVSQTAAAGSAAAALVSQNAAAGSGAAAAASALAAAASQVASSISAGLADVAADTAIAAANATGPVTIYNTKPDANAALAGLPELAIVEVIEDDSLAPPATGNRTRYRKVAGVYVFLVNLDQLRTDLANPAPGFGAFFVAFQAALASMMADANQQPWTVQGKLENSIDVFENFTAEERVRVLLRTGMSGPVLDLTAKINSVLVRAKQYGKSVFAPAGLYPHAGLITIDSVGLFGEGDKTDFRSTDTTSPNPQHALFMTGAGPSVRGLLTSTTWAGGRQANTGAHAVALYDCTDFAIEHVNVTGAAAAGILGQYCRVGAVNLCKVTNTLADSIHFTNDSHNIFITNNYTENSGDDNIAVVSYIEPRPAELGGGNWPQSSGFVISNNQTVGSVAKINNGVSLVGAADVLVNGHIGRNLALACVGVNAQTTVYNSYSPSNILVANCKAFDCALEPTLNHAQFYVFAQSGGSATDIHFCDNFVTRSAAGRINADPYRVQMLGGATLIDDVTCDNLQIDNGNGTGKIHILGAGAGSAFGQVSVKNTRASNFADGPYQIIAVASGRISITDGDHFDVFSAPSLNRFVNLGTAGTATLEISGHKVYGTANFTQVYAGDASATTARPYISAIENYQNSRKIADVIGVTLNGANYQYAFQFNTNYNETRWGYRGTAPLELLFSATRHQNIVVEYMVVRDNDVDQRLLAREHWIRTNAAAVGVSGVDYVDVGGGFRVQRTAFTGYPVSNGTVGAWTMTLGGGNITAVFTPTVSSHIEGFARYNYKAA